ncbi:MULTISPECIES: hypothetical protein [unclassified Sporosarcina]|uniref:hypothetical protein n=1 Tax=unclassified Sporosarcina TaxID=2647733 RepID=UPI0012F4DA72|nr:MULTISPECIES: hypothetical protein [unclassified Sporosarcina]
MRREGDVIEATAALADGYAMSQTGKSILSVSSLRRPLGRRLRSVRGKQNMTRLLPKYTPVVNQSLHFISFKRVLGLPPLSSVGATAGSAEVMRQLARTSPAGS